MPLKKQSKTSAKKVNTKIVVHKVVPDATNGNADELIHSLGNGVVCDTERRGHPTPQGRSPHEIVVDASEGFIPLWEKNVTLHWRFSERSFALLPDAAAKKLEIRTLLAAALVEWGTAAPVRFKEDRDLWDFEIVMRTGDQCSPFGCVLASAFFPDPGRHELVIYPKMFTQPWKEQVDTFIHEIGHVFGLRHFFALVKEKAWPAEIFGTHAEFSIMNYGHLSELTKQDKEDLTKLYKSAWNGTLKHINGTPIKLVKPFNTIAKTETPARVID